MRNNAYKTEEITTAKGNKFRVELLSDDTGETPWEWSDGHGKVSAWTSRDKKPGEVILCADYPHKRYYDMQGAIKKAREEGWFCEDVLPTDTKGQKAVKAAQSDFNYLKAWCEGDWWYCCLHVVMLDAEGRELDGYDDYLGGVADGHYGGMSNYSLERAQNMAEEIEQRFETDLSYELTQELHHVHNHALYEMGII